eukprot:789428-Prorocentrum_minimum.AAC.2
MALRYNSRRLVGRVICASGVRLRVSARSAKTSTIIDNSTGTPRASAKNNIRRSNMLFRSLSIALASSVRKYS